VKRIFMLLAVTAVMAFLVVASALPVLASPAPTGEVVIDDCIQACAPPPSDDDVANTGNAQNQLD
jgi:hypothetical protein